MLMRYHPDWRKIALFFRALIVHASLITGEVPVKYYSAIAFRLALISPFGTPHFTAITPPAALFANDMYAY